MFSWLHYLHGLTRRNLSRFERVLVSAGLASLVLLLAQRIPVYPDFWDIAVAAAVFGATLVSPALGYSAAVAAVSYPLFSVSIYIAVLFFAAAVLGARIFISSLGAVVIVCAAPFLNTIHLAWIIPLLGGIWWGVAEGVWMAVLSVVWLLLCAGLAGLPVDLLILPGVGIPVGTITARFAAANSLETLQLLAQPFTQSPTQLLYVLLQGTVWGLGAALAGKLLYRLEGSQNRIAAQLFPALGAGLFIFAGLSGAGLWLSQFPEGGYPAVFPRLIITCLAAILLTFGIELLRDFIEHPLPYPAGQSKTTDQKSLEVVKEKTTPVTEQPLEPVPFAADLPQWEATEEDKPDGLIQIELD